MGNCTPTPPQIKDRKMARFGLILDFGGGGGWGFAVPFYSVQDCTYKQEGGGDFIFSD